MAKFHGFESRPETLNFIKIVEFELFGTPKWLNFTVLNPGLETLNFIKIVEFELFGGAKMAKFHGFESRPETLEFYQNRRI